MSRAGRSGRKATFATLWELRPELTRFVRRKGVAPATVEDVVDDVYVVVWRRLLDDDLPDLPDPPGRRGWLFGTAVRVLANHRRCERRMSALVERVASHTSRHDPGRPPTGPEGVVAATAWISLPEADRQVLVLAGLRGLGTEDLAKRLGCSPGAAMTRLSRARARLASALHEVA